MKVGVLVDHNRISVWQARALAQLPDQDEIVVYNCTNGRSGPRRLAHALYYALNLFTVRNPMTRSAAIPHGPARIVRTREFEALHEGLWQRLPPDLLREIETDEPRVILKFGLGLLRIPPVEELAPPILSYHHGDPEAYRGRPAGFYELLHGRPAMGQIVQVLSNALDAGAVVAFCETRVHSHSYRATLMEAYRASPLLLPVAIRNAIAGRSLPKSPTGKNYRLPTNGTVARLCAGMARNTLRRLTYGAFVEKAWAVSTAPATLVTLVEEGPASFPNRAKWRVLPCPKGYNFIADPFFEPDGTGFLVEALHHQSGKGELVRLEEDKARTLTNPALHHSYPGSVTDEGAHFLVPEVSLWSEPRIYRHLDDRLEDAGTLNVPGRPRLLDPTLVRRRGRLFLFANDAAEGGGVLRLWHADQLFGSFAEHPASPILISPAGARMAGEIVEIEGRLLRFGQDFRTAYGDGLIVFEIETMDTSEYSEKRIGGLRFSDVKGPHTLNFRDGTALFDWYRDRFSPLSGVRRLRGRLHRISRE